VSDLPLPLTVGPPPFLPAAPLPETGIRLLGSSPPSPDGHSGDGGGEDHKEGQFHRFQSVSALAKMEPVTFPVDRGVAAHPCQVTGGTPRSGHTEFSRCENTWTMAVSLLESIAC
jgi:hypothetical protein